MNELYNPFIDEKVPSDVEARLRKRLGNFQEELAGKSAKGALTRPIFRLAFGGAAIAGLLLAAAIFVPGRSEGKGLYAAVVQKLSTKKTIAYTMVISSGVEVEIISKSPGLERKKISWGVEMISDESKGKSLILFHREKAYLWEKVAGTINGIDNLNRFEDLPEKAERELGKRLIDGRSAVGFRVTKNTLINTRARTDVWIDPITRRLVHVNIDVEEKGVLLHRVEIKNIRINEPVDDSLFDLTPPVDYRLADGMAIGPFAIFTPRK